MINIPPRIKYAYKWKPTGSFWLCAEHTEGYKIDINGIRLSPGSGFSVWRIGPVSKLVVLTDKKIDNIYISYSETMPTQFI